MTQERLRELLRERVADEVMPDRSAQAWRAARVVRRRRRLAAAGGVVAASVAVSGALARVDSAPEPGRPEPGLADPSRTPSSSPTLPPGAHATYRGAPVWWSPDQDQEHELPPIGSPLPAVVDLDVAAPARLSRAVAAFALGRSIVLVGPDGAVGRLSLEPLQEVVKPNGYSYLPTSAGMLSPEGTHLAFIQPGSVAVLAVATGAWSEVDTSGGGVDTSKGGGLALTWVADDEFVVTGPTGGLGDRYHLDGRRSSGSRVGPSEPPFDRGTAQPYGRGGPWPDGGEAQSYGMGVPLPVRDPSLHLSAPEFLATEAGVLVFTNRYTEGQGSRFKECCPVAGWLDADTVVYESRQTRAVLVAWRVGTSDFGLVSRIDGAYDVASFAL